MKNLLFVLSLTLVSIVATPAHAQGGCDDSPEDPTLVLAGLASGAYGIAAGTKRIRSASQNKQR